MTGNRDRTVLTGVDPLLMSTFLFAYPHTTADEICAFIVNNGGDVYNRDAIYKRLKDIQGSELLLKLMPRSLHTIC
jgi:hypothetical protein